MAPGWKNQSFVNGRWLKVQNKKQGGEQQQGNKQDNKKDKVLGWHDTKADDWACIECDSWKRGVLDTYMGNYASANNCRGCGGH